MNPCLPGSQRLVIGIKHVEKYISKYSHRRIFTKITKQRFSYSYGLKFSLFTVVFTTLPHRSRIVDFLFAYTLSVFRFAQYYFSRTPRFFFRIIANANRSNFTKLEIL